MSKKKALFLIDGVHTPGNTVNSIKKLCRMHRVKVSALIWIGGTEKIESRESFSEVFRKEFSAEVLFPEDSGGRAVPEKGLRDFLSGKNCIDTVVQLSGAPQIFRSRTVELARISVSFGASYIAGGTVFSEYKSPVRHRKPSIGLYATNKRVGKTAFGSYIGGLICGINGIDTPFKPVIITHSRGGPPDPPLIEIHRKESEKKPEELTKKELLSSRFKPEYLARLLDFSLHGASDVFEDALIISTYLDSLEKEGKEVPYISLIGCRRAGAGYYNEFAVSNVDRGIKKANSSGANLIIHEGSGAEHPPAAVDGVIFFVPSDVDIDLLRDFPGLEKALLFILANCQRETSDPGKISKIKDVLKEKNPTAEVFLTRFEPEAVSSPADLKGKKALFLTTAPDYILEKLSAQLSEKYDLEITETLNNLDRDEEMKYSIDRAVKENSPDCLLVEIKARGVEGARYAENKYSLDYFYINNIPRLVNGDFSPAEKNNDMDRAILKCVSRAVKKFNTANKKSFPFM